MFKVKETSVTVVLNVNDHIEKAGFSDVHDAYEYAINVLGQDSVPKNNKLIIQQRIILKKVSA